MGIIYQAKNKANGKQYVGRAVGKIEDRKKVHEKNANNGSSLLFHRALCKYGFDTFEWRILFDDVDEDDLNSMEITTIRLLKTKDPNGYNLTSGGEGIVGAFHSDGWRAKRKEAALLWWAVSENRKRRVNQIKAANACPERGAKISKAKMGHSVSLKQKERNSVAARKQWASFESRARILNAMQAPEARVKLSLSMMNNENGKGSRNGMAKLTETGVKTIRALSEAGDSYELLAKKYQVKKATIGRIIRRESWRHVS